MVGELRVRAGTGGRGTRHDPLLRGGTGDQRAVVTLVIVLHHVGDDDRDVVGTAALEREFDQPVDDLLRAGQQQRIVDGRLGHDPGQAVGAQQVPVAGDRVLDEQVRLDVAPVKGTHQ